MNPDYLLSNVPDQLLDQMAWIGELIQKQKAINPNSESLKPYTEHLRVLNRVFTYINDTQVLHRHNYLLKDQNQWLTERFQEMQARLTEYETVMKLKSENRLEEMDQTCSEIVERGQYWLKVRRDTKHRIHTQEIVHESKLQNPKSEMKNEK